MRVCFLLHQGKMSSGGQGVYLSNVTREVAALGHEVHVMVGPPYPDIAPGITMEGIETFSLFDVYGTFGDHFRRRSHPRDFLRPLNFYELVTSRMGMFSGMSAFSVRAFDRLREIQAERRFDIIHDVQVLGYGTLLTRMCGLPVVANVHHPLDLDRRNAVIQARSPREKIRWIIFYPFWMQHVVARRVDRIITGSHKSAASVREAFGLPAQHIEVIHDGVDTEVFRPLDDVVKAPNEILFVGNSDDRNKGARYLIEAMRLLRDEDLHLTFVDKEKGALELVPRLVRRYGLGAKVTFTGRVSTEQLVRLYNRTQLLVSPSVYEGFGLPAAEAQACGTAVVSTTAGALPEVVEHGETGWLVPPADAHALAEAIRRLMADAGMRARMGAAGRQRMVQRFTWRETARKTVALYEEVLEKRRSMLVDERAIRAQAAPAAL